MDHSIVKLLEEEEDESMHSGADVDAFQAALNRDIEGDMNPSQPCDKEKGVLPQENQTSLENIQKQDCHSSEMEQKQHGSVSDIQQQQLNDGSQEFSHLPLQQRQNLGDHQQSVAGQMAVQVPQTTGIHKSEKNSALAGEPERINNHDSDSQYLKLQQISNQQASGTQQTSIPMNRSRQVPFGMLLPALLPQLDPDRAMQLRTLYGKLKKNEIAKEGFVRHMRDIVGDKVLKFAVQNLNAQLNSQSSSSRQTQFTGSQNFSQLRQNGSSSPADSSHAPSSAVPMETDSTGQGHKQQQPQHLHFPQTSLPIYGNNSYPYSGPKVNTPGSSLKPQPLDPQLRQITHHQNMGSTPVGGSTQAMNVMSGSNFERPNSMNDANRLQSGSPSLFINNSTLQQNPVPRQLTTNNERKPVLLSSMSSVKYESVDQGTDQQPKLHFSTPHGLSASQVEQGNAKQIPKDDPGEKQTSRIASSSPASVLAHNSVSPSQPMHLNPNSPLSSRVSSVTSPAGVNSRTPPKRPSAGQKKPLEALGSSPPLSSKKQKVSGAFSDQSIEQLNDVTAVSGVNLREEEEQLFSGPTEDSRVSEASRRVVQEEEERLILHRTSLQKKLAEIMVKSGLKNISNDVERCLSLCVEERLRGLVCNLIRLSKQRVDAEKSTHQTLTITTTNIQQQIATINKKTKEELERKQAEVEKLRKVNEPEGDGAGDADKEKDEVRVKSLKVNKEEDDKMRTTAANVAARAAVGGDDMLSKWQLMAEQARQKREGVMDTASGSQAGKYMNRKPPLASGQKTKDNQEAEKRGPPGHIGGARKFGRNQGAMPQTRVARTISIKDVIAVLEREPQMSKSTMLYRLYGRIQPEARAE
ncbi:hypothetical protein SLE2022_341260 [Rubroshorea leprosula]